MNLDRKLFYQYQYTNEFKTSLSTLKYADYSDPPKFGVQADPKKT